MEKRLTEYVDGVAHGRPGQTIEKAEESPELRRGEFECSGLIDKLAGYENIGTREQLAGLMAAKSGGKFAKISRIAEIIVLEGGYEITCGFCIHNKCQGQVSGLTCLRGVEAYLQDALKRNDDLENNSL